MKVFIVEDNELLLKNLEILLCGEERIEVVGVSQSAEEALMKLEECEANILITDLGLPNMQGVELVSKVRKEYRDMLVIVNTISEDTQTVFDAIRAGASGYMLKGSSPRDLIGALFELYEGGAPMSPRIAKKVIAQMHDTLPNDEFLLSHREKEVLQLIEQGLSYTECASKLCISRHTVNSHIKKIYQKLHAQNKSEALTKAKQKGII